MSYNNEALLRMAVEITTAAVGASGEKSGMYIINYPENTTDYIQAVYDKLKMINESM